MHTQINGPDERREKEEFGVLNEAFIFIRDLTLLSNTKVTLLFSKIYKAWRQIDSAKHFPALIMLLSLYGCDPFLHIH